MEWVVTLNPLTDHAEKQKGDSMALVYFDPFSGLSGDMIVGAFLDVGVPFDVVHQSVQKLGIRGLDVGCQRTIRHGVAATKFEVAWSMADPPVHRHLPEILNLVENSGLDCSVQNLARTIFVKLSQVEAEIHGETLSGVHLHEVGAEDSLADIVAAAASLMWLKPHRVVVGPINLGAGFMYSAHGRYPVPGPATLALLKGFVAYQDGPRVELATPTGAAIAAAVGIPGVMPLMTVKSVGYGAGQRDLCRPNVLRVVVGEDCDSATGPGQVQVAPGQPGTKKG